jgi:hypothetical protein
MLLVAVACGGAPLLTTATCDPYTGFVDFYRNDDSYCCDDGYYTDAYYVDYYDDCGFFYCF